MRKIIFIFFLCGLRASAQYPSMSDFAIDPVSTTTFKYNCGLAGSCHDNQKKRLTEIPPWIIGGGRRSYFFDDGRKTNIWSSPSSLIDNSEIDLKNNSEGPFNATYPYILDAAYSSSNPAYNWKRNYHAIYSAQYIHHPVAGAVSIGFCHGENKNEVFGPSGPETNCQNTIQSNVVIRSSDHSTYSGGSPYQDGWDAYNAIISASWLPNNQQTNWGQGFFTNDLGPIVWPSMGYVTKNDIKATVGLRHPSSIVVDKYIYIYYIEGGVYKGWTTRGEGRQGGVKIARVLISDALDPTKYQTYYKDRSGNQTWTASLPAGLTKDNMLSFVSVRGPKSSDVLNDNGAMSDVVRFSVARVKNTNYFIGVEQYRQWGSSTYYVAVRFSSNLLDWSPRQIVYSASDWDHSKLNYPILLDNTGWSNNEVDADDFYIIGSENEPREYINKLHIYKYGLSSRAAQNGSEQFDLRVMPNPVSNTLSVEIKGPEQATTLIRLYNAEGKLIKNLDEGITINGMRRSYDISMYPRGLYYLEVIANKNRVFKKIIKL